MQEIKLNNKIDLSDIKNKKNDVENNVENEENVENDYPVKPMVDFPDMQNMQNFFTPVILSPEEQKERRKKIIKIKNYIKTFPDILTDFISMDTKNMTLLELDDMIEEIRLTVSSGNNTDLLVNGFLMGCNVYEKSASYMGFNLDGLSNIVARDSNIIKCIKEISLEYQNLNYVPPEKRLLLLMCALSYGVYNMNNMKNQINNNNNIDDNLKEKYNDL